MVQPAPSHIIDQCWVVVTCGLDELAGQASFICMALFGTNIVRPILFI